MILGGSRTVQAKSEQMLSVKQVQRGTTQTHPVIIYRHDAKQKKQNHSQTEVPHQASIPMFNSGLSCSNTGIYCNTERV